MNKAVSPTQTEKVLVALHQNFLDSARDTLDRMEEQALLRGEESAEALLDIYRSTHNLKGNGGTFGLPAISLVAHRFEDYLKSIGEIDSSSEGDVLVYIDALRTIINDDGEMGEGDLRDLMRKLPSVYNQEFEVEDALRIEVALVTPSGAVGRLVARDLAACGYRVTSLSSPWQAMQLCVCAPPDLLITSVVMDQLSGVDLVAALRAMGKTASIRLAVLTSFDDKHQALSGLPAGVPIIRTGSAFRDDLAKALDALDII